MRTPAGEVRRFASCSIRHFTRLTFINSNIVAQAKVSSSRFIHCLKRETLERDDYTPCTRHQPASTRQCGANHRDRGNQIRWLQHFIFRQKPASSFLGKPRRGSPANGACATIAIAAGYAGVSFVACPLSCSGNQFDTLVKHSPNRMANRAAA
jgi:hypothetical protein